jgi:hypothetical protein
VFGKTARNIGCNAGVESAVTTSKNVDKIHRPKFKLFPSLYAVENLFDLL